MARKSARTTSRKSPKGTASSSVLGNIALEVIAIIGFLILFTGANHKNTLSDSFQNQPNSVDSSQEHGSLVSGFVSDQLQRFGN
ncbi:MAG: hypothetical protein AAGA30_11365 [Planctomycetota bacterium]